jgi:hypothetical protein
LLLFSDLFNHCILHSQKLDVVSTDVDFWKTIESVATGSCVDYGVESKVHPVVAGFEVACQ